MSSFDFPRLSRREILEQLSLIATVSESNLIHPDPDFIFNLYAQILLCIEGQQEEAEQMEFGALEQLDFPDHHVHSVPRMNLYNKIHKLVSALGCPYAFTPKDLIKPEPNRTEIFLSALLNFNAYREQKLEELKPLEDDLRIIEERRQAAEARTTQLKEEISHFEEARESELPLIEELSSNVKELNNSVADLNKHQVKLKSSLKELKDMELETDAKVQTAEYELVQAAQENATLKSKIVQSPDKLQKAFEDKKLVHNQTKNAERAAYKSFQDKTAQLEGYDKACKKMTKLLSQMQAIQEQVNQAKSVDKDTKALKSKLSDDGILDKSLEAKITELQATVNKLKESEKQLEKEISHRIEEATKELNNVKVEVGLKRQALESRQKQVESVVAEADAITSQIRIVKEEGEVQMQELERKSKAISDGFHRYTKRILDTLAAN